LQSIYITIMQNFFPIKKIGNFQPLKKGYKNR
jgi:hypothetical protein